MLLSIICFLGQTAYLQTNKTTLLPIEWFLSPAGKQLPLGDLPLNLVISADKSIITITNNGQSTQSIQLFDSKTDTVKNLNEVLVTATRKPMNLIFSPFSTNILLRKIADDFMYRSTPEALNAIPGVFIQKTNHGGGSPFLRGLTGNQTLILIDGIRLNNSTFRYGPNQYLNTVDNFTIDRVEVVKGSGSVQYGSDAIGGIIQILSQDPEFSKTKKLSGQISARYWNKDIEKTGRTQLMYSSPKLAVLGGVSVKKFGDLVGGSQTGRQIPSGYDEIDIDIKLKMKFSDQVEMIVANQLVQQKNVPIYHKVQLENFLLNEVSSQQRNLSYIKLKIQNKSKYYESVSLTSSLQHTVEARKTIKNGSTTQRSEKDEVGTANASVDVYSNLNKNWSVNTGLEYYRDRIASNREDLNVVSQTAVNLRGLYPDGSNYSSASIYHLHHLKLNNFNFEGGIRLNQFQIKLKDENLGSIKIAPSAIVTNLGINYAIGIHHLYSSLSSGYRAPNIDDMGTLGIVDFRYEIPSYNLKPEKNYNTEIGYKVQQGQFNYSLSLYRNNLRNLISRIRLDNQIINGYPVYKKENIERATIMGVETSIKWEPNNHFSLNSFLSYNYGKNITNNEPLRRIPPFNGNTSIKYSLKEFYTIAELGWATKQDRLSLADKADNRIPTGGTAGWKVLNAFIGYQYKPLQLKLGVQNIFNEDYRTHGSGINGVGRSILLSCNYSF